MKRGAGRKKGSVFERKIAKIFSKWSGSDVNRTPLSGGWAKNAKHGVKNDLISTDPNFPFGVECLPAGTCIITDDGAKYIEDIKVGMRVLTHLGRWREVTSVFKRRTDKLVHLQTALGNRLRLTEEHPVWTTTGACQTKHLQVGVKILAPVTIDKSAVVPTYLYFGNNHTTKQSKPDKRGIIKCACGCGTTISCKDRRGRPRRFAKFHSGAAPAALPDSIQISPSFCELLGWFLAEGHALKDRVVFTVGIREMPQARRICNLIRLLFGLDASIGRYKSGRDCKRANVIRITVNSVLLGPYFKHFGYRSRGKTMREFVGLDPLPLACLIGALWDGDGHTKYINRRGDMKYASSSRLLINELSISLTRLGIPNGWCKKHNGGGKWNTNPLYYLQIPRSGFRRAVEVLGPFSKKMGAITHLETRPVRDGWKFLSRRDFESPTLSGTDHFARNLESIRVRKYNGYVHNFSVQGDESYIADSISVHNCKHQEKWLIESLLHSKVKIFAWWKQCVEETPKGKIPLLVFHRNLSATFAMISLEGWRQLKGRTRPRGRWMMIKTKLTGPCYIFVLTEFLKQIPYQFVTSRLFSSHEKTHNGGRSKKA